VAMAAGEADDAFLVLERFENLRAGTGSEGFAGGLDPWVRITGSSDARAAFDLIAGGGAERFIQRDVDARRVAEDRGSSRLAVGFDPSRACTSG